jgi:formylglycine-generating enzyme required for sulfatase activity
VTPFLRLALLSGSWAALLACGAKDRLLPGVEADVGGKPTGGAALQAGQAGKPASTAGARSNVGGAGSGGAAGLASTAGAAGVAGSAGMTCQGGAVGQGPRLIAIPAGTLLLGSLAGDADEAPQVLVTLAGFELDETEVTVSQYDACVASACCTPEHWDAVSCAKPAEGDEPVACVDWQQADQYCRWVGKRLPDEAEWELAARGPEGRLYPWGSEPPGATHANLGGIEDGFARTAPIKTFEAGRSPLGLYDLAGNVWEWTRNAYCPYLGGSCSSLPCSTCADATRVSRGGGWYSDEFGVRSANRNHSSPSEATARIGFRCAR